MVSKLSAIDELNKYQEFIRYGMERHQNLRRRFFEGTRQKTVEAVSAVQYRDWS
jgi:hypothetical protein